MERIQRASTSKLLKRWHRAITIGRKGISIFSKRQGKNSGPKILLLGEAIRSVKRGLRRQIALGVKGFNWQETCTLTEKRQTQKSSQINKYLSSSAYALSSLQSRTREYKTYVASQNRAPDERESEIMELSGGEMAGKLGGKKGKSTQGQNSLQMKPMQRRKGDANNRVLKTWGTKNGKGAGVKIHIV